MPIKSVVRFSCLPTLLLAFFLVGCSQPLPEDRLSYVGEWQSNEMALLILADGTVSYERLKNGGKTSINAPLKEFQGDSFVVGIGPLTTVFDVSAPPRQVDGRWEMVVDGVRLIRIRD